MKHSKKTFYLLKIDNSIRLKYQNYRLFLHETVPMGLWNIITVKINWAVNGNHHSFHESMFLTNVAPFKRRINRLANGIKHIAKKYCYNRDIYRTQISELLVIRLYAWTALPAQSLSSALFIVALQRKDVASSVPELWMKGLFYVSDSW